MRIKNASEISESAMYRLSIYRDIELSEQQIESGQVKDAGTALEDMRAKYGF
ncbi:MAG: hypothetical protein NC413_04605 [Muribaculum sp.]|nr:hypothetical protein [Muribaculum sp.]